MTGDVKWIVVGSLCSAAVVAAVVVLLVLRWIRYRRKSRKATGTSTDVLNGDGNLGRRQGAATDRQTALPARTYDSISSSSSSGAECYREVAPRYSAYYLGQGHKQQKQQQQQQQRCAAEVASFYRSLSPVHKTSTEAALQTNIYLSSEDEGVEEERGTMRCCYGRVWLSMTYDRRNNQLVVLVNKAKYLPGRGMSLSTRNVFCRVYLLPDETKFLQSKMRKRTLAPKFNDTFVFSVSQQEVLERTLRLSLYDVDRRHVRHSLGHVLVPLSSVDLTSDVLSSYDLRMQQRVCNVGEVQVQLYCNPAADRLRMTISRLTDIRPAAAATTPAHSGVYIKVCLYHGNRLMKVKRTSVVTLLTPEVYVDESFTFAVAGRHVDNCSLRVEVVVVGGGGGADGDNGGSDKSSDDGTNDRSYGRLVLGSFMYARGEQLLHWQEMMTNPRTVVTRRHTLEPSQHEVDESSTEDPNR